MVRLSQLLITLIVFFGSVSITLGDKAHQVTFDDYIVHYNAFSSEFLNPTIARAVGVKQSGSRAVLTLAVKKKLPGQRPQSVAADIRVNAFNLVGQNQSLNLREIRDRGEIYYISDFNFVNSERMRFNITVRPEGDALSRDISFTQRLFRN